MNIQQHAEVKQLFLNILSVQPENKTDYLLKHTADQDVIDQVLELVNTYENNTQPTREFVEDIAENISQSALIFPSDRYILIEKIGQGGMGDVYLAQRKVEGIKQNVAIKILHKSDHISQERFLQEAAILSQLSHPHISQFIDADFLKDGRPYVVMEYTEGQTITEYCNVIKADINTRISLFILLCDALQHAHRNLIIHRDIKPDNILVNDKGTLKLLDFGIAKIIPEISDKKNQTKMHALTPSYASPEQFMGKAISVSTDVYSLGVVLYELLTGARPYESNGYSIAEFETQLKHSKPEKPSIKVSELEQEKLLTIIAKNQNAWVKNLSGDLDKIILKSLQYDISQRYQSIAELVDDLHRYKNNLPVLAQTPSLGYQLNKFIKRNKIAVVSGMAFAVFAITFMTIIIFQNQSIKNC